MEKQTEDGRRETDEKSFDAKFAVIINLQVILIVPLRIAPFLNFLLLFSPPDTTAWLSNI
jgi:hypothetical protein